MADVTFPSLPHVVSLLHFDDVRRTKENAHPAAGYPVVCVTVGLSVEKVSQKVFKTFLSSFCRSLKYK